MARNEQLWEWARNEGIVRDASGNVAMPTTAIPDGLVYDCANVDFSESGLIIPRTGVAEMPQTGSPPTVGVRYLFAQTTASTKYLWAFQSSGSGAMTATRWNGSTWASVPLSDTVATLAQPHAVQYNGKVFVAYDSNVNRLHLLDPDSTTPAGMRRAGIGEVAAPSVANTGAGAYAATIRYYKVQMAMFTGTAITANSELSAATSFTPSGAGTAARITKPTTIDSATHWRVFASADGVTYYALSAWTNTATTTIDDSAAPSTYANGTVAPLPGLYVPPPSCKYLATDGTRLIMAGAWEATAASGETTPATARVWFTRPLGATDEGDDESITSTAESRYWIDIDDPRGSGITAIHQIGGVVYVFFTESVWRLLATGSSDTPYRAEQVSTSAGAVGQYATCVGQMPGTTEDAIYFVSASGFYRISAYGALEWLGRDVLPRNYSGYTTSLTLAYDYLRRDVWMFVNSETPARFVINVDRLVMRGSEPHGGARRFTTADTALVFTHGTSYNSEMVLGGGTSSDILYRITDGGLGTTDVSSLTASATSQTYMVPGQKITVEEPLVQIAGGYAFGVTLTATYTDPYSPNASNTSTVTFTTAASSGVFRVPGLVLGDANAVRLTLSTGGPSVSGGNIERAWIPYRTQEPL